MRGTTKRWWGALEEPDADNDQITVGHKTLDALADDICRANIDLLRLQTVLAETQDAIAAAQDHKTKAEQKFIQRCSEKFDLEIPLPKQEGAKDE
jgi:hypothetical protein